MDRTVDSLATPLSIRDPAKLLSPFGSVVHASFYHVLLKLNWAGVFREHLLGHLPVGALAAGFCEGHGGPRKDLSVALGALILQKLRDLTHQQPTEAVALSLAWHYRSIR